MRAVDCAFYTLVCDDAHLASFGVDPRRFPRCVRDKRRWRVEAPAEAATFTEAPPRPTSLRRRQRASPAATTQSLSPARASAP